MGQVLALSFGDGTDVSDSGMSQHRKNKYRIIQEKEAHSGAEPIRSEKDIDYVVYQLLKQEKWRDAMLIVLGINSGWRISDLVPFRACQIIDAQGEMRNDVSIQEKKTSHVRKVRYNRAVQEMFKIYMEKDPSIEYDSYLFTNQGPNKEYIRKKDRALVYGALSPQGANLIIKRALYGNGLHGKFSTHTLRKTLSYHVQSRIFNEDQNAKAFFLIQTLQAVLGHTNSSSTHHYSEFAAEKILEVYSSLNLGLNGILKFKEEEKNGCCAVSGDHCLCVSEGSQ